MRTSSAAAMVMVALGGAVLIAPVGASAGPAASYRAIRLGTLGGPSSVPYGLNDHGAVVGWASTAVGAMHPFWWRHGEMADLGTLDTGDGGRGIAVGINRFGTVVGQSDRAGMSRAVRWQNGEITDLGTLGGGVASFATAINDRGVVVGGSVAADGVLHAFIWRDGRMTDLGVGGGGDVSAEDINNEDQVVGWATSPGRPSAAYLWQRGKVTFLTSSPYGSQARAVNDRGEIVGSVFGAESGSAVRWWRGGMTSLGSLPGGDASGARDVNDRGMILGAGNVRPGRLDEHPFLWRRGVFTDLSAAGVPESVSALNNVGQLIGTLPNAAGDASTAAVFVPRDHHG